MTILSYVGYILLLFLAASWTLGVRLKLGVSTNVVFGALFFVSCSVVLPLAHMPFWHAWWMIPAGYALSWMSAFVVAYEVPILSHLIRLLSLLFAAIIRVGIPKENIRAVSVAANLEVASRFAEKDGES